MKITPNSLTLNQLFSSKNEQFIIPAYQRRYSWRERQIYELIEDVDLLENGETHLLGSIVCLTGNHTAGLNHLELVDGQQRITTISIILECIRERFSYEGEIEKVGELTWLLTAKSVAGESQPKIALDSIDGSEFRLLVAGHADRIDLVFKNLHLKGAFAIIREWISKLSLKELNVFLYKMQNHALIIRLDINEAKDAFKLFETINNRGLKLSATDVIKNFVLGNAARFGSQELNDAREKWASLVSFLDGVDTDSFFRYFVISSTQKRITNSQVVPEFKWLFMNEVREADKLPERHLYADEEELDEDDPSDAANVEDIALERAGTAHMTFNEFLQKVVVSARVFGELILIRTGKKNIDRHLRNLKMIKSAQTYGFLMHLRVGGISDKEFIKVLKLTENFILRRHVCRERSNETEALFARLCSVSPQDPVDEIIDRYKEACPSDDKFREEFASASFTSNIIDRARYCLEQIELTKHGDYSELDILGAESVHVEHIIPQKIKTAASRNQFGDWVSYLGEKSEILHPKLVGRIGNLTLFSGELNIEASNNPFLNKRKIYKNSAIQITKELSTLPSFKFRQVEERSKGLADIAVARWPSP
jgi:hypothetical protein